MENKKNQKTGRCINCEEKTEITVLDDFGGYCYECMKKMEKEAYEHEMNGMFYGHS